MNIFGSSAIVSNLGNRNLEWQKTLDRNIGFDIIFLDNRLRVNFDYFNKRTDRVIGTDRYGFFDRCKDASPQCRKTNHRGDNPDDELFYQYVEKICFGP